MLAVRRVRPAGVQEFNHDDVMIVLVRASRWLLPTRQQVLLTGMVYMLKIV